MNNQLYYLIKDKPKFNKVRFEYIESLRCNSNIGIPTEIYYENGMNMANIIEADELMSILFGYTNVCGHAIPDLNTNQLSSMMIREVFKIKIPSETFLEINSY